MRVSRKLIKAIAPIVLRAYERYWGRIRDESDIEDLVSHIPPTQPRVKRGKQS